MGTFIIKPNQYTSMDSIIIAGQSNATGTNITGTVSAIYQPTQMSRIFWKNNNSSSVDNGTIQNLCYNVNNNWQTSGLIYQGSELSLGYQYSLDTGLPLFIIKYTAPGTFLVDDGITVQSLGLWDVNANATRANNILHYNIMLNNFILPAIQKMKTMGITLNIKAFSWIQGESDAANLICSNNYYTKFVTLFDKLVTDLTSYNVLSPNFKPIISGLNNSNNYTYYSTIATAQTNISNHYVCPLINTSAYVMEADNIHYTKAAQTQQGLDINTQFKLIP